jgi:protein-tyrosine-phosphatase
MIEQRKKRVLSVCTENSNRSQMAEAFPRMHGGDCQQRFSAGPFFWDAAGTRRTQRPAPRCLTTSARWRKSFALAQRDGIQAREAVGEDLLVDEEHESPF